MEYPMIPEDQKCTGGWIIMQSGSQFWPTDPKPEHIHLEDIAHSLAMQVRWNGHIKDVNNHYSVAQHSVYASYLVPQDITRPWALVHDATETYLCDVPRPIKPFLPEYAPMEEAIAVAIRQRFGIYYDDNIRDEAKIADTDLLFMERDKLVMNLATFDQPKYPFEIEHLRPKITLTDLDPNFSCWSPAYAKQRFLERFQELGIKN